MTRFDYHTAFSRNIGWLTPMEQAILRGKRVAIAGLGGVGGSHLLTLTRLGIGAFTIADLDAFELANLNRQAGARISTMGQQKTDALCAMARDINPELVISTFDRGINDANIDGFLQEADLYVDGLDYFAVPARRTVFSACAKKAIPAVTAAPLGMGAAVLNFLPGGMSFEEYFQLEGQPEQEQLIRFLLGLSPRMLQRGYLVYPDAVDFARRRGPSTPMACDICAGMAATEALKILLGRGGVLSAPRGQQFDAYANRHVKTWRPGGNRNPLQRIGLAVARRQLKNIADNRPPMTQTEANTPLENILDLARWAPSGDNTQPWRFEIVDESTVIIHGSDTRDWCVYDLEGRASQIAIGAMLETLAIAATGENLRPKLETLPGSTETHPLIKATFAVDETIQHDPLRDFITSRTTQRRAFSGRSLTDQQKGELEAAVAPDYQVIWLEGAKIKRRMARLLFDNAHIRLTIPEAYRVHKQIIQWDARFSEDRIPDQALGIADPVTLKIMRWAMQSWERITLLNRYFAGTWLPRIQLDIIPALRCGGHFVLTAPKTPADIDDYLSAGRSLQRFWLTATGLDLLLQPEMTPLIFSGYVRDGIRFTREQKALVKAQHLQRDLESLIGAENSRHAVFMGRLGFGPNPTARSIRLPLKSLLK